MTNEQLELAKEKLKKAKEIVHEIERNNDRSRRIEWRQMKKFIEYAEREITRHKQ